jgi:hypothetical protein
LPRLLIVVQLAFDALQAGDDAKQGDLDRPLGGAGPKPVAFFAHCLATFIMSGDMEISNRPERCTDLDVGCQKIVVPLLKLLGLLRQPLRFSELRYKLLLTELLVGKGTIDLVVLLTGRLVQLLQLCYPRALGSVLHPLSLPLDLLLRLLSVSFRWHLLPSCP